MKQPSPNSFVLCPISSKDIFNLSYSFHIMLCSGAGDVDAWIANTNLGYLAAPLSKIINCSFSTGIVPSALNIAKLGPIFKQGSKEGVTKSRPISILPFFSKIFEKLMHERLYNYVRKMNIFYPLQHGFQSVHSTSMPLLDMQDEIFNAIDDNK